MRICFYQIFVLYVNLYGFYSLIHVYRVLGYFLGPFPYKYAILQM